MIDLFGNQQIKATAAKLAGLAQLADRINKTGSPDDPRVGGAPPAGKPKRKRAKKIRQPIGPLETSATGFDRGTRPIEIVSITPGAIVYRLRGCATEYSLPHGVAFQKAASLSAGFDTGPRTGAIRRGVR